MSGFVKFGYGRGLCGFYCSVYFFMVQLIVGKIVIVWVLLFLNDLFYYDENIQGYFLSQKFVNENKTPVFLTITMSPFYLLCFRHL